MRKDIDVKNLSNKELEKLLSEVNYCDKELLDEYDDRCSKGVIKFSEPIPLEELEDFIKKKYANKKKV